MSSARELKERGNAHYMRKQYAQATEWYTRAIEADPSVASIYTNRAAALYAAGKYSEAADDAKTSVGIDEKWVKGWYRLGLCLEKLERLPAAVEAFELGLKVNLESYAACSREACVKVAPRSSTAELTRAARRSRSETLPQADPTNAQLREGLERTSAAAEALPKTATDAKAMGNAAYKVGQYEEASKWYTYAMDLLKSGDAADATVKATLLTNRAEAYRQQALHDLVVVRCRADATLRVPSCARPIVCDHGALLTLLPRSQGGLHGCARARSRERQGVHAPWARARDARRDCRRARRLQGCSGARAGHCAGVAGSQARQPNARGRAQGLRRSCSRSIELALGARSCFHSL